MVVRHRKKKNKLRGSRTHGWGNTKNRRGSGSRGGVGNAGGHKHKYSSFLYHFGNKIKLKPKTPHALAISLDELEKRIPEMLESKTAENEGGKIIIDGQKTGISKILGNGEISQKIILRKIKATAKAVEKIKAAGGSIEEKAKIGEK